MDSPSCIFIRVTIMKRLSEYFSQTVIISLWYQEPETLTSITLCSFFFFKISPFSNATDSAKSKSVVAIITTPSLSSTNLITINVAAQLPLKLTSLNYFSWRPQFNSLFYVLDLLGFLDGSTPCPASTRQ